ncbi:MAG: hypothetical protein RLZZ70_828 [Candidatus Parcubacteria bacterium]
MQYGVDVASTRLDGLDKRVLADVRERISRGEDVTVLDVGCGQGGLAAALVEAGARVLALDIVDYSEATQTHSTMHSNAIDFRQADIRDWLTANTEQFDLVVLQRVIHYLPYTDALAVLERLHLVTDRLYLSVTGTTTAIARHYDALTQPLPQRWGKLDLLGQELFSISAPLCIYSAEEVRQLLVDTGWCVDWLWVSDFGNCKVVARVKE